MDTVSNIMDNIIKCEQLQIPPETKKYILTFSKYSIREIISHLEKISILSKIGEPYLRSNNSSERSKTGLGLGLFIGKTLLEKNFASIDCRNSKTRSGAEVIVRWNNRDLFYI